MTAPAPLDPVTMPLTGAHAIEASAGTGKTYALALLYLRAVIEAKTPVEQILTVTFTEAAAAELKTRLRSRLIEAEALLARFPDAPPAQAADPDLLAVLERAQAWSAEPAARRAVQHRLETALLDFDRAAIATIHGFCQRLLQERVFETGDRFGREPIQDQSALVQEAVADFIARAWGDETANLSRALPLDTTRRRRLDAIARMACAHPEAAIRPEPGAGAGAGADADGRAGGDGAAGAPPLEALEADFEGALQALAQQASETLAAARRSLLAGVENQALHAGKFKADGVNASFTWLEQLARTQDRRLITMRQGALETRCRRLRQDYVHGAVKKQADPGDYAHPLFEAVESVTDRFLALHEAEAQWASRLEAQLAAESRAAVARRKAREGTLSFSDMISGVHRALEAEAGGDRRPLAEALRRQYPVVLVDEFQDTDTVQFQVFDRAFARACEAEGRAFIMIGDPKQSIYSFRGADVESYLEAHRGAGAHRHTMGVNHRSDASLVAGVQSIFSSAEHPFRDPRIELTPIEARHPDRLRPDPGGRVLSGVDCCLLESESEHTGPLRREVAEQAAADIVLDLEAGAEIPGGTRPESTRPLHPGDIAVLCRNSRQLQAMAEALTRRGVPSVRTSEDSVFAAPEAEEVDRVLTALADPADAGARGAALATPLFGHTADALARLLDDEAAQAAWRDRFERWHRQWRDRGFIEAWRTLVAESGTIPRLAGEQGGERRITNLLHLGELLHRYAAREHLGPGGLLRWLRRMRAEPQTLTAEERQLRLETDARAVQLSTIHKAKGLEWPLVYVPFAWNDAPQAPAPPLLVRATEPGEPPLILDVGSEALETRKKTSQKNAWQEAMRLLYVALTRPRHRLRFYVAAPAKGGASTLFELIGEKRLSGARAWAHALGEKTHGAVRAVACRANKTPTRRWFSQETSPASLAARPPGPARPGLCTSSYSALAGRQSSPFEPDYDAESPPEPTESTEHTEHTESGPAPGTGPEQAPAPGAPPVLPLAALPGGLGTGLIVHELFESLFGDKRLPADPGALAELARERVAPLLKRVGLAAPHTREHARERASEAPRRDWAGPLATAVTRCLTRPLAPGLPPLATLPPTARACEMNFALRAGAPDRPEQFLTGRHLHEAFSAGAAGTPAAAYAGHVRSLPPRNIRGFLTGFIDLVVESGGTWYLLDWKTHRLGPHPADYAPEKLRAAIVEHDYVLQYHLYALALRAVLAGRVPDFDYAQHFGGIAYVFLRGVSAPEPHAGPGDPMPGVFVDRPEPAVLDALDHALGRQP